MPYFRVDDHFHHHPKALVAGNAAIGLWVRAGSYMAAYTTDGRIEQGVVRAMGTRREIQQVTAARLWVPDGDEFVMLNFLQHNPSAEQVHAQKESTRSRQARWRASHPAGANGVADSGVTP